MNGKRLSAESALDKVLRLAKEKNEALSCKSESAGSEDFFMRQDEFLIYIEDKANPARAKAGLPEIGQSEARACFRILEDFYAQWRNPPNNDCGELTRE